MLTYSVLGKASDSPIEMLMVSWKIKYKITTNEKDLLIK